MKVYPTATDHLDVEVIDNRVTCPSCQRVSPIGPLENDLMAMLSLDTDHEVMPMRSIIFTGSTSGSCSILVYTASLPNPGQRFNHIPVYGELVFNKCPAVRAAWLGNLGNRADVAAAWLDDPSVEVRRAIWERPDLDDAAREVLAEEFGEHGPVTR